MANFIVEISRYFCCVEYIPHVCIVIYLKTHRHTTYYLANMKLFENIKYFSYLQ